VTDAALSSLPSKDRTPRSANILNGWVTNAAKAVGVPHDRLTWIIASTVALAVLQRATASDGTSLFAVKGGAYLEHRLEPHARSTRDVDTLFRGAEQDFLRALDDAIAEPWGPFTIRRGDVEPIANARAATTPRRFDLRLEMQGRPFRRIPIEVSFGEGDITAEVETFEAPSLAFFGIRSPDHLVGITLAFQVAQKLHAATDPDTDDRPNDRVRDIVDLIQIRRTFYPDDTSVDDLRRACHGIFAARADLAIADHRVPRAWPPQIVAWRTWSTGWAKPAADAGLTSTLDEALEEIRTWVSIIDRAGSRAEHAAAEDRSTMPTE
jgi:hypothetical protein